MVLIPPEVPKSWLVSVVPVRLAAMLAEHNAACEVQERIRLRMALHAGEVHQDAHGWAGVSLNRAFRLIDAPACRTALNGSSGVLAVIASDWFYDEVVRHDPAAEPACFHRVRVAVKETDMTAWIRVLEAAEVPASHETGQITPAVASGGQIQSPPLQVRFCLPPDAAAFTGRDGELERITAEVTTAAGAGRVVAIHAIDGMPGIGKTTLAVHAAHLLKGEFADRQLFIDLRGHTPGQEPLTPESVLAGLLSAVGVEGRFVPADLPGRTAMWRDRMAGQQALLVLDNAASSAQVIPLLPGSEGCLVLVTSRRHLGDLPGAVVPVMLEVLAPTEAREMFVRLAPRAVSDSPEAVAELVRLAGFLPLAISLLARVYARQPSWSLADLAAETRGALLTLTAEKDTVAAAFDVSYRHLSHRRQRFFRRLGLHLGTTIDAYAAAALAGVSLREAAGHLDGLYGESLLTQASYLRYGMHDLIRRYARVRAAASPAAGRQRALDRLLDYYQHSATVTDALLASESRAAPVLGAVPAAVPVLADRERALAWAQAERANLLACLDHATGTGQHARTVALTAGIAALLRRDGPWAEALTRHATGLYAAQRLHDRPGQANALYHLGNVRRLTGDNPGAARAIEEALSLYGDIGDQLGRANALCCLGSVRWQQGDCPGAVRVLEEALEISCGLDDQRGQANALGYLGSVRYTVGDYTGAIQALEGMLDIYRGRGDRLGQANALWKLGAAKRLSGDYPGAAGVLVEALDISSNIGNRHAQADTLSELGIVRRLTGDYPDAARILEEALSIHRGNGDRPGEAEVLNETGTLHMLCGRLGQAEACHEQALSLARQIDGPLLEAPALAGLGRCALATGDTAKAQDRLRQALEIFNRIGAAEATDVAAELEALAESQLAV